MHEEIPLNPSGASSRNRRALYLWWGLNISLVLFVFLAFVFSAASLSQMETVEHQVVNNNYINNGAMVPITRSYRVVKGQNIAKGAVVSFTENQGEVAQGLGPRWDMPQNNGNSFSPATYSDIDQFADPASVYAYVPSQLPNTVQVMALLTLPGENITTGGSVSLTVNGTITHMRVRCIGPSYFVLLYTYFNYTENENGSMPVHYTFMVLGAATAGYMTLGLRTPQFIMSYSTLYTIDMLVLRDDAAFDKSVIQIASAPDGTGCQFQYWKVGSVLPASFDRVTMFTSFGFECTWPMDSIYLPEGKFLMVNEYSAALATINFDTSVIEPMGLVTFEHMYETVTMTTTTPGIVVLCGTQKEGLEGPVMMTQVIEWTNTSSTNVFIKAHWAVSLIPSMPVEAYRHHIRATWVPPQINQPAGVLLFTYVDSRSLLCTLVRGQIGSWTGPFGTVYFVTGSARVLVSTVPYTDPFFNNNPEGPLLYTTHEKAVMIYQTFPTSFNSFIWVGGYRVAGVSQNMAASGNTASVTRLGMIPPPTQFTLETGFSYYPTNDGGIRSALSVNDVYTPNGYPYRLGVATSDTQIMLDDRVVNRINDGY